MPSTSRKTDNASGHGCFPPSVATVGSPNVDINDVPALRQGDAVAAHGCRSYSPHGRAVAGESPTVSVNGRPLARIGNGIYCGGTMEAGSPNVLADDGG
ncbi:hypothetical protein FGD77_17535 [Roseovarius sp. M141]|nr:hypothetical protein [Roseovarius sp. M141]